MHIEPRAVLKSRLICIFAAATLLSACGGSNAAAPTPLPHFEKGASSENLAPNSNSLGGWAFDNYKTQIPAAGKPVRAVYVGTGKANSASLYSPPVPVVPGRSYMFSAWIDPRHGSPVILVASRDRFTLYGQQIHVSGKPQRFSDPVTIPQGVTQAVLTFTNAGSTTPRGKTVVFSQPMFRADGMSRPYKASIEAPINVYLPSTGTLRHASGTGTILNVPGGVSVVVRMTDGKPNDALWIAKGACAGGAPSAPWKQLTALKNGRSTTIVPGTSLVQLKQAPYSLAVRAAGSKISIACGNLNS